jgi:hypothetical protein
MLITPNDTDNSYIWFCLSCGSVESTLPDAPGIWNGGSSRAGDLPRLRCGGGKADSLSEGASGEWTLLLFAPTAPLLPAFPHLAVPSPSTPFQGLAPHFRS